MILLLGGTSETAPLATLLAQAGYRVLVSTATEIALDVGEHPNIRRRCGALDLQGLVNLLQRESVRAVVDAAHPYAVVVHATAREAAETAQVPYLRYLRPTSVGEHAAVLYAQTHDEAAALACAQGGAVLLTTGSHNLTPYAREAGRRKVALFVRVLPEEASLQACRDAGVSSENVVAARGPFSADENRALIKQHAIKVLVTKDSGTAGGLPEKLEAAQMENCTVVVVRRPEMAAEHAYSDFAALVQALRGLTPPG